MAAPHPRVSVNPSDRLPVKAKPRNRYYGDESGPYRTRGNASGSRSDPLPWGGNDPRRASPTHPRGAHRSRIDDAAQITPLRRCAGDSHALRRRGVATGDVAATVDGSGDCVDPVRMVVRHEIARQHIALGVTRLCRRTPDPTSRLPIATLARTVLPFAETTMKPPPSPGLPGWCRTCCPAAGCGPLRRR